MPQRAGRLRPCLVAPALAFAVTVSPALAESGASGPWEIEAVYKNDVFDRCALGRALDNDISVTFVRADKALSLLLSSPFWQLEAGKDYPVTIKLGPQSWSRDVAAKVNSVSMTIDGEKLLSGLRAANTLDIVAAGATIRVPLDGSTAAFERLERCVARAGNIEATRADPQIEAEAEPDAEEAGRSTAAQTPPPPPAKPQLTQEGFKEEPAASSVAGPPPPTAKPEVEAKAEDARAVDAPAEASAAEAPAAAPAEDARAVDAPAEDASAEDASAEDAVLTSEEESPAPPAAKPEKPPAQAAKKASPAKKRNSSSAQSAKRAFQREIDRIRRFFGN